MLQRPSKMVLISYSITGLKDLFVYERNDVSHYVSVIDDGVPHGRVFLEVFLFLQLFQGEIFPPVIPLFRVASDAGQHIGFFLEKLIEFGVLCLEDLGLGLGGILHQVEHGI